MNRALFVLPLLALVLAGCDAKGNPNTDGEAWAMAVGFVGVAFACVWIIKIILGRR